MRSICLVLPTFLFILTAELVLAKRNWGSEWLNSKLNDDRWKVSVEPSGLYTGWYQLACEPARAAAREERSSNKSPTSVVDACETSCRCNMFGELLLNPLAAEICNNDSFLKKCVSTERNGLGCKCIWLQQTQKGKKPIKANWRDLPDKSPGEKGDAPLVRPGPPHESGENPSFVFRWFDDQALRKN
ncbi:hypothetical protein TWF506_000145 [Arthrobotrys conoides]|uniref:Uncharacterized protein n=1 Tax=Arthrobotrys conoides TaxID=74498 RepID=A0AAN8NZE0_9PEZI